LLYLKAQYAFDNGMIYFHSVKSTNYYLHKIKKGTYKAPFN